MFDKIAEVVIGLLKGIYGLSASVVSGVINTVVTGTLIVRRTGAAAGANELTIATGSATEGYIAHKTTGAGLMYVIGGTFASPGTAIRADASTFEMALYNSAYTAKNVVNATVFGLCAGQVLGWSSSVTAGTSDTTFSRLAAGVVGCTSWLQQTGARSRVTGDITNITITPAAITGLSATLIAGRKYAGEMVLFCSEVTAADGLRLDYDGGAATATTFIAQGYLSDDNGFQAIARTTALATDTTNTTITGSTVVVIKFCIVCNGAGTFIPRFAKEADAAGAALTVSNGSYMWIEDMPA